MWQNCVYNTFSFRAVRQQLFLIGVLTLFPPVPLTSLGLCSLHKRYTQIRIFLLCLLKYWVTIYTTLSHKLSISRVCSPQLNRKQKRGLLGEIGWIHMLMLRLPNGCVCCISRRVLLCLALFVLLWVQNYVFSLCLSRALRHLAWRTVWGLVN